MPIVSESGGTSRVWTFAGGLANAALSEGFPGTAARADDFGLIVKSGDAALVSEALGGMDGKSLSVSVSEDAARELKFSECLPAEMVAKVVQARLSDPQATVATLARPRRVIRDAS